MRDTRYCRHYDPVNLSLFRYLGPRLDGRLHADARQLELGAWRSTLESSSPDLLDRVVYARLERPMLDTRCCQPNSYQSNASSTPTLDIGMLDTRQKRA